MKPASDSRNPIALKLIKRVNPHLCIVCQSKNTKGLQSGENGRRKIREVAEKKKDVPGDKVYKRLQSLPPETEFKYHNTSKCYKGYTKATTYPKEITQPDPDGAKDEEESCEHATPEKTPRKARKPRTGPSPAIPRSRIKCPICGGERVYNTHTKAYDRTKFRLCEEDTATSFLAACQNKRESAAAVRCADLTSPGDVFTADLHCHVFCFKRFTYGYVKKAKKGTVNPEQTRVDVFNDILPIVDSLIQSGYGLAVSEVRDMLSEKEPSLSFTNKHARMLLKDHYVDRIRFCASYRKNESALCFSSDVTLDDVTRCIRNRDACQTAGEILSESFDKIDFNLNDKFGDSNEIRQSWHNTPMPEDFLTLFSSLFKINRSRLFEIKQLDSPNILDMMNKGDDEEQGDEIDDDGNDDQMMRDNKSVSKNQHVQLFCLFQIIFYQKYHGLKSTPLAAANGQYIYNKNRSREMLSIFNKIGASESYAKVRKRRKNLALYQVAESSENEVPVPSTFQTGVFCTAALDNGDFGDQSSISGTQSSHVTMINVYQAVEGQPKSKPNVSSMNLEQYAVPDMLPCQEVPPFPKPVLKPTLPQSFIVANKKDSVLDTQSALEEAKFNEFLLSYLRCAKLNFDLDTAEEIPGLEDDQSGHEDAEEKTLLPPTWHGAHALISTAEVPLMRVSFAPVIPFPVTDYSTVRKAMQNLQSLRRQINPTQSVLPAGSDEGVYHTFADIQMEEAPTFDDLHGLLGNFHLTKVGTKCGGRFLRGSGLDVALTETKVFGKHVLNQALEGTHYVRALYCILVVSDTISSLAFSSFHDWIHFKYDSAVSSDIRESADVVRQLLSDKKRCPNEFHEFRSISGQLYTDFETFTKECTAKSEVCEYLATFQEIANLNKFAVSSDREGNFALHLGMVEKFIPIFRENDCLNYLRYGMHYLESSYALEKRAPEVFSKLSEGYFVVKDKEGFFNAVPTDMKLEQTVQRASKSTGGVIGQARNLKYMIEWLLSFHEVVEVSTEFRELMQEKSMMHSEFNANAIHHELIGSKALSYHKNVVKLFNFLFNKGNPFDVWAQNTPTGAVRMQNLLTRQLIDSEITKRYLKLMENGQKYVEEFRNERFVRRRKKLGHTISKRSIPRMDFKSKHSSVLVPITVTPKMIAAAQRSIDIVRERGMKSEEIYRHDFLPTSSLFDGHLPKKVTAKSQIVTEIQTLAKLSEQDMCKPDGELSIIVDLMSRLRSCPSKTSKNFGDLITHALSFPPEFDITNIHVVRDSYIEDSTKSAERARRAGGKEITEYCEGDITEDVPLPSDMECFWPSESNKVELQAFARVHIAEKILQNYDVIVSGVITDSDIFPAERFESGRNTITEINYLKADIEEADDRIPRHTDYEVKNGSKRILVISNDSDTVARLLYFMKEFNDHGLTHLWVMFGTGESRRYLPLHKIYHSLGNSFCKIILKAHVLTGDDALSKIGTKHAALTHDPVKYLSSFGESETLCDAELWLIEEYLVKVWAGANTALSFRTFSKLRLHVYTSTKDAKPLDALAPTSNSILGHVYRSFSVIRDVVCLLDHNYHRSDPLQYKWHRESGILLPDMCLNPLPDKKQVSCKCEGKCSSRKCSCKAEGEKCTAFCHGKTSSCLN